MTTTGSAGFWCLAVCRNSRPFIPGSLRSVRTRCTGSEASSFNPVSASPAESVLKPSSPRFSSSSRRILASSSMMRMVGIWLAHVGTGALARPSRAWLGSCLRLAAFFERKEECKHRAASWGVLDMDCPMMTVHDLRNNGEAESYAGFLRGHKWVEDFFAQCVGNTGAGVSQAEFHTFTPILHGRLNLDPQRAAGVFVLHGLVGVLHEIEEGLLAQAFVERNGRQVLCVVAFDAHRFTHILVARLRSASKLSAVKAISDNLQDAIKKRDQVRRMRLRVKRTSKIQKLGNQGAEPVDFG